MLGLLLDPFKSQECKHVAPLRLQSYFGILMVQQKTGNKAHNVPVLDHRR